MDSLVFFRIVFLLCWYFIPMVGTFSFYGRGHYQEYQKAPTSFDIGNVWQDQPTWDPLPPFHTGNDWQQNPPLDISSSLYSGNVWQDQQSWDPPSPFVSESVSQQEPFTDPPVSSNSGNEWHQWASDFSPSTRQPGSSRCRFHSWMPHPYCAVCRTLPKYHKCHMYCPCP